MKRKKRVKKLVMVFFGMTATGKSFVARAWAEKEGNPYFNSDIVRKELAGRAPETRQEADVNAGIYSPAFTRQTYDELIRRAECALLNDETCSVVLDASYQSRLERDLVRLRMEGKYRVFFVHCTCSEEIVKERLALRAEDPHAISDGRWDIYLDQKKKFEMPVELGGEQLMTLETEMALPELLQIVEKKMSALRGGMFFSSHGEKRDAVDGENNNL
ncbi:MAG: AAA family ATPase [Desulfoprunum sp.]|nr:AAA family ATPase [Desulfoprunum sp.]